MALQIPLIPQTSVESPYQPLDTGLHEIFGQIANRMQEKELFEQQLEEQKRKAMAQEQGQAAMLGLDTQRLGLDKSKAEQDYDLKVKGYDLDKGAEDRLRGESEAESLLKMTQLNPKYQTPYAKAAGIYDPSGVEEMDSLLGTSQGAGKDVAADLLGRSVGEMPQQPMIEDEPADMVFALEGDEAVLPMIQDEPTDMALPIVEGEDEVVSGEAHDQMTPPGVPTKFGRVDTAAVRGEQDQAREQWSESFLRNVIGIPEAQIPGMKDAAKQYGQLYNYDDEKAADAFREDVMGKLKIEGAAERARTMAGSAARRAGATARSGDRLEVDSALAEYHRQTPEKDVRDDVSAAQNLKTGITAIAADYQAGRMPAPATQQAMLSALVKLNDPRISNQDIILAEGGRKISILDGWTDWMQNRGAGAISARQFGNLLAETKRVFGDAQVRIKGRYKAAKEYRELYRDNPRAYKALGSALGSTFAGWSGHKKAKEKEKPRSSAGPAKVDVMKLTDSDIDNMSLEQLRAAGLL